MKLKIYGFRIKVVNVYSPTENGSESSKDIFYRLLRKSCSKTEKHEKLIVTGDFNAKTSIAFQHCCFDGTNAFYDNDYNDNGERMKEFCMSKRLCIASTFFDYPDKYRFTWYSCDKKTKRINDYTLVEKYVQDFITDCKAQPEIDFDSDHRILITYLHTPMTRKARKKKQTPTISKPDIKSLNRIEVKTSFVSMIESTLHNQSSEHTAEELSSKLISALNDTAQNILPPQTKIHKKEVWKNDYEFNLLISNRRNFLQDSDEYKKITKSLKKRINHLKNEKLKEEARSINHTASRKEIEELYKAMKDGNTTFRKINNKQQCNVNALKNHFKNHFNTHASVDYTISESIQLRTHDQIGLDGETPDKEELTAAIRSLKNGKSAIDTPAAYVKHA